MPSSNEGTELDRYSNAIKSFGIYTRPYFDCPPKTIERDGDNGIKVVEVRGISSVSGGR